LHVKLRPNRGDDVLSHLPEPSDGVHIYKFTQDSLKAGHQHGAQLVGVQASA